MDRVCVIKPSIGVNAYIQEYWFLSLKMDKSINQRIIPNGYLLLSINRSLNINTISGLSNNYTEIFSVAEADVITIVFKPLGAFIFLGLPLKELNNQHVLVENIGDNNLEALIKQLSNIEDKVDCISVIEKYFIKKLHLFCNNNYDRLAYSLSLINSGINFVSLLSDKICIGYKQYNRIFNECIGINPKEYIKQIRFQKVLNDLNHNHKNLTELAFKYRYFDKSHLIKEFRSYAGYTPSEYSSIHHSCIEDLSLFRSTFIDID